MSKHKQPVIFKNKNGLNLYGILHEPDKDAFPDIAVIILSPGIKSRVAPHRLYVKLAERFCELGYKVFRFDFYGLGDSEGTLNEVRMADVYGAIQVGRYKNDTIAAMDFLTTNYGVEKFILSGLCGGAITGLFAGADDQRVIGLHAMGIPVILDSSNVNQFDYITKGQLVGLRKGYIKKLTDWRSWLRFLSFKTDYKILFKSLFKPFLNKKIVKKDSTGHTEQKDNFNTYFPEAFHKFAGREKILLIFSESDRLYWEFKEKYLTRYEEEFNTVKSNIDIVVIPEANHIFSFTEWQQNLFNESVKWINEIQMRKGEVVHGG